MSNKDASRLEMVRFASGLSTANTSRAYASDWNQFLFWCQERNTSPLPVKPDDLALFLRYSAETLRLKIATVQRRLSAISEMHRRNGFESPVDEWVVKKTIKRLRQEMSTPIEAKNPLLVEDLKEMLKFCPVTFSGVRDKAILLLGFCGGFRRNDLVNLDIEDIAKVEAGLILIIRKDKSGSNSDGRKIGIPYGKHPETCPVKATLEWIKVARFENGPLFRGITKFNRARPGRVSDRIVTDVVKKYCALIGKHPAAFSAHSLRSGFATSAALGGASERSIQKQTGHTDLNTLRKYTGEAEVFRDNALNKINL